MLSHLHISDGYLRAWCSCGTPYSVYAFVAVGISGSLDYSCGPLHPPKFSSSSCDREFAPGLIVSYYAMFRSSLKRNRKGVDLGERGGGIVGRSGWRGNYG